MGQIIAMPSSRAAARGASGGSAEILFFLGVRYHRMTDEEFAKATAGAPSHAVEKASKRKTAVARPRPDCHHG